MTHHATEIKCSISGFITSVMITLWENQNLIDITKDISWHFCMGAVGGIGAFIVAKLLKKLFNKKDETD